MTENYKAIKQLMQKNIVKAVGCTEPVAVSLCVSKCKEVLGEKCNDIQLLLSKNIIKNAMGVGIPGTNMIGLPIAVSLAVVCGDSSKKLEVLCNAKENLSEAKQWLATHTIDIKPKDTAEKLYIECIAKGDTSTARVIIAGNHTNFIYVSKNNETLYEKECHVCSDDQKDDAGSILSAKVVYDYALNEELSELEWIKDTYKLNTVCSEEGLTNDYGLRIGKILLNDYDKSIKSEVIARTCAASDARMDGVLLPIYSNSGSGNQGITCTLPVYYYAKKMNATDEKLTRALTLSHLMSIYIKGKIGRLSAMCGLINASMGVASALVYLQNGSFNQICYAIRNMINTITGIVCDGAKPSCALKVSACLSAAFDSVKLAMNDVVVDDTDGIAQSDIDLSIDGLSKIGKDAMNETDEEILYIMTHKRHN